MSKRIVPVVTATVCLIIKLIGNWSKETVVDLLEDVMKNGDFQNTNVNHWKPILSRCEEYLKEKFEGNIEDFREAEEMVTLETRERVLVILRFLTKVVENVKDASTYSFKLGWPLMNLTYYFDLEVATQASFLLSEICSDGMKIDLLFEGTLLSYDEFIRPLVEIGSSSILSSDGRPREPWRVYDFYERIQGLRVGDCSEANIDERLIQIKYDMKRIMMTYRDEFSGVPFCEEINESSKLKEHLDLLKKETVSLQLKSGVLRYIRTLFECISSSSVSLIDDSRCFSDDFVLSLWEMAISNTVPIGLVREIMNSLECFAVNAPHNLDLLQLIANFLDFVVNNLKEISSCGEQKKIEVLKCFIKILEQGCLKEEEIDVIVERIKEIVSQLYRRKESPMKCFGVYLEVVECFLRKPSRIEKVPIDTLIGYKNILIFVVNNCEKFTMEVRVSVVKGLGTLNNVEVPEDLEDFSDADRCPECGRNYMGLLAMLVKNTVLNPCFAGEALHSITEIFKNERHEVRMWDLELYFHKLEELCCTFIGGGTYPSENHFMQNLMNVLNLNPNFDENKCTLLFIIKLLMKCIDEKNNEGVVLSDLQPETLIWFDDALFPECNFDEEICMLLGLLNCYLNGAARGLAAYALYSSRLAGVISYSNLSYKFHQNSSEFTSFLKNACQYFNQDPECYRWFIKSCFWKIQKLSKETEKWFELDDRSRIYIVIALIRMVDILFIDSCDPRKKDKEDMSLDVYLLWKTLEAVVEIRGFILSLYNKNLTSPEETLPQYTQNHLSRFILPPEFVDDSFWSLRGIDKSVGHINRTIYLLFRLQLYIFDRILLQDGFFLQDYFWGTNFKKLRHNVILSIVDEVKKALKPREERNATCVEEISGMGSTLGRILNMMGDKSQGDLFFNIGIGDEICTISMETNGRKKAKITFSKIKDPKFYTKKNVEIQTPHLSKILRFYYPLFGEIKERGAGNEDIARNLMIFLKYVSKSDMNISDVCIFVKLVDMGYCMINRVKSMEYSDFINMIDPPSPLETKLTIIDSILDIKDECLKDAGNLFKYSGKFKESAIQDFIQKVSTSGFYHVRYKIDGFTNQLRCIEGVELDTSLIELISNNFLIYSFLNPCECRGDDKEECTSHYDRGCIIEFIDCLDKYLSDSTLEIILKSYSSLLKLSEIDESPVSKEEIFKRFPLKRLLSLTSSSKEFSSMFKLFNVVIEQFLESKGCVRRLIDNELLINKNGLDVDNVEATVDMWKSLAFRNMEIFVECIRNKKKSVIARRDQSRDKLCEMVVKKVIGCIDEVSGHGLLSLQLLTEIIFNRPCLSVLCGGKGFIENTIWRFIKASCEEKGIWGRCFINVIFTRTNNLKLKKMIHDVVTQKMRTADDSLLRVLYSLLLGIFDYEVHVEKYDFSEGLVCDEKDNNEHNCDGYCEAEEIFKQNVVLFSNEQLFELIFDDRKSHAPVSLNDASGLVYLSKALLSSYLKSMVRLKEKEASIVDDEVIMQVYLDEVKKKMGVLLCGFSGHKPHESHEDVNAMSVDPVDMGSRERKMVRGLTFVDDINLERPLSKWCVGEEMMGESIDLKSLFQNHMKRYELYTSEARYEGNAPTINTGQLPIGNSDETGHVPIMSYSFSE